MAADGLPRVCHHPGGADRLVVWPNKEIHRGCPGPDVDDAAWRWLRLHAYLWADSPPSPRERLDMPLRAVQAFRTADAAIEAARDELTRKPRKGDDE